MRIKLCLVILYESAEKCFLVFSEKVENEAQKLQTTVIRRDEIRLLNINAIMPLGFSFRGILLKGEEEVEERERG